MPCLFLRNVPPGGGRLFSPEVTEALLREFAAAAGVGVEDVQVHIEETSYLLLLPGGTTTDQHGVHGFVEWHEGRSPEAKQRVATAIQRFLEAHGLGGGFDLAFRDYPRGSFFFEGKSV